MSSRIMTPLRARRVYVCITLVAYHQAVNRLSFKKHARHISLINHLEFSDLLPIHSTRRSGWPLSQSLTVGPTPFEVDVISLSFYLLSKSEMVDFETITDPEAPRCGVTCSQSKIQIRFVTIGTPVDEVSVTVYSSHFF